MTDIEIFYETTLDSLDLNKLKPFKSKIIYIVISNLTILLLSFVFLPYIINRNGIKLIDMISIYWLIIILFFVLILKSYIIDKKLFREIVDRRRNIKIVIETQVKVIVHTKNMTNIVVTNQNYKNITFEIDNNFDDFHINDNIILSFLPKSKTVLDIKRIKYNTIAN